MNRSLLRNYSGLKMVVLTIQDMIRLRETTPRYPKQSNYDSDTDEEDIDDERDNKDREQHEEPIINIAHLIGFGVLGAHVGVIIHYLSFLRQRK